VGAAGRSTGFNAPSSELRLAGQGGERTVAFAPTYFPGTPVAAEAAAVTLGPSEEREGVDFALQLVRTARVEGTVTAVDGTPAAAGTLVNLIASAATVFPGTPFNGFRSARVGADGGFSFADVSPGNYTVLARGAAAAGSGPQDLAQIAWASTDISVDGETIDGLALGLQPAQTMTGQIRFDAERLTPPADLKAIRLTLEPVQSPGAVTLSPTGGVVDPLGHFEIAGVVPGRYRLLALLPGLGRPGQWHLRSSIVNGQDTLDVPVVIRPNESIRDAVITLTDRPAQITGAVQNAAGGAPNEYTVILFPADQTLWLPHARRIQAVRPSADGVFTFQGLPAGDYLLAAIDDVEYGEWFDPALLQRLVPTALRTVVADGEHKVQDIRLGGGS
jgi:hypothetical protein